MIDSQSVKTTESGGIRGYDAGKKTKGRKRHIIVDTLGLMVGLMVHSADIQDRDGAPDLLKSIRNRWPWLLNVFADGGYAGDKLKRRLKKIGRWTIDHQGSAASLGGRAHLCMARWMPKIGQGRRAFHRISRGVDHDRPHSSHHPTSRKVSISLKAFRVRLSDTQPAT
ncbi:transposase [Rhizobium leguminosarum]|nr:transposase [Rhizobium leguminosarum]